MEHRGERIIAHMDLDAFFAAVEEREDPSLKGRPVIIGADPKGGQGRGIVATANYEARRYGVHSALPISTAFRRCPKGVLLPPRFALYAEASRKVMALLRGEADVLQQASIDEATLDLSSRGTFEAARDLCHSLQARIRDEERLSSSFGVGPNKLVAKLASDHKKPAGLTVVIPSRVQEFLDPKSVRALRGVGPKTEERLLEMGFKTVADLRGADEARLRREFGGFGDYLWREARGLDDAPVDPVWEAKSIGREHTFDEDSEDPEEVRRTLLDCVRRVHEDLRAEGHWCRTVTVKVRFEDFETHSRQTTLKLATGRREHLEKAALTLVEPFLSTGRRFRLVGFSASKLVAPEDLLPLA